MNPDVIIPIILIIVVVSLLRTRMGVRPFWERAGNEDNAENVRLRQEVEKLQERIRILERIVTDRGAETAAQIEALRDRDRIAEEDKL